MTARAAIWAAGLGASALTHGAALALLLNAADPDPIPDQPTPASKLDVQAYQLDRTEAREAPPDPQTAPEATADSPSLDPGAIPQSRAQAVAAPEAQSLGASQPAPETLAAETAPAPQLAAATPAASRLQPAERPAAATLPAATLATQPAAEAIRPVAAVLTQSAASIAPLAAATVSARPAPLARPTPVAASAVSAAPAPATALAAAPVAAAPVTPPAPAAPNANPETPALPAAQPLPDTAPEAAPQTAAAPAAEPQADRVKATLAFPGGDGGVDPVSLAAFQSFMQPGDIQSQGDSLRDGVGALLSQVPCSRLQVAFDPDTATLQVNGHIPEGDLRAPVLAALQQQMGADIAVSDNILILPRPQCGALTGIGDVGLPQSTDQITNPLVIGEDAQARVLDFVKDDRLWFDITAPDYDAFIYVDFFDAGGNVLHLTPNEPAPLARAAAETAFRIGARDADDPGLQLFIGPPYGQEIAVAFAASAPLYDGLRPLVEPAAPYLDWLKARVADARAENPDFKGEWVYFFVTTAER